MWFLGQNDHSRKTLRLQLKRDLVAGWESRVGDQGRTARTPAPAQRAKRRHRGTRKERHWRSKRDKPERKRLRPITTSSEARRESQGIREGKRRGSGKTASTAEQRKSAKPATLRGQTLRALRGLRRSRTLRARLARKRIMRRDAKRTAERTFSHERAPFKKKPRPLLRAEAVREETLDKELVIRNTNYMKLQAIIEF